MPSVRAMLSVLLGFWSAAAAVGQDNVDYIRDVKPIVAQHCIACHGAKVHKAKLRLDTAAFMLEGGASGPAIVPGKAAQSPLIEALKGTGGFTAMPFNKQPLPEKVVSLLTAWIDQGAKAPARESAD